MKKWVILAILLSVGVTFILSFFSGKGDVSSLILGSWKQPRYQISVQVLPAGFIHASFPGSHRRTHIYRYSLQVRKEPYQITIWEINSETKHTLNFSLEDYDLIITSSPSGSNIKLPPLKWIKTN